MIALARKTLAYEWRRFLPVVLAMCFAGVLLIVQAALVLGIFGTAAIYVKASSADIWAGFPGTQSVNYGHAISADVESHLRMDPDVTRVEPYEWVDGEWRSGAQGTGNVSVYLSGISTRDDAMMFARILPANLRAQLREPGAVIVDSADLDTLGVDLQNNRAWINGKAVRVVAAQPGLRGLGGVNVLASLDTAQMAAVFAGEVHTWEELGGKGGAIRLYARDEQSGTYDTFKELVLASHGKSLASDARRFESNDRLAAAVSADPHAIGFVGIASVGRARALAIADGESLPMAPQESLIATEDYPLSRRLFLYLKPGEKNPWAQALVRFAQGPRGQAIVTRSGFVAQKIQAVQIAPRPQMPAEYRKLAEQARRLTVNFRFQEGSALLDNKALLDVQRLLDYLRQNRKLQERTVLVGFGDPKSDAERSVLLSRLRAMAVRRELARGGVSFREIAGFGDELPVASNDQELGRQKNRRVEVWVY